jgi:hypothetical protein
MTASASTPVSLLHHFADLDDPRSDTGGNSAGRFDYLERVAVAGNSNINPAPEEVIDDA